ncbi:MAG TPA: DnaJ domain-containing protein [Pseudoxanthomonas sp.]
MRTESRHPLSWPAGWQRAKHRSRAMFGRKGSKGWKESLTVSQAVERVRAELQRLGVREEDSVISTNLELRLDGYPRSNQGEPADPGVAVYWLERGQRDKEPKCMAIDRYDRVADNLAAIAATLEAMRAIERHGGGEILTRAFAGFTALPAPVDVRTWSQVLGVPDHTPTADVREAYRRLRSSSHPDKPTGDAARFNEVQAAWESFCHERGIDP